MHIHIFFEDNPLFKIPAVKEQMGWKLMTWKNKLEPILIKYGMRSLNVSSQNFEKKLRKNLRASHVISRTMLCQNFSFKFLYVFTSVVSSQLYVGEDNRCMC